jgi:hypothetical protein
MNHGAALHGSGTSQPQVAPTDSNARQIDGTILWLHGAIDGDVLPIYVSVHNHS